VTNAERLNRIEDSLIDLSVIATGLTLKGDMNPPNASLKAKGRLEKFIRQIMGERGGTR
jgi:hypothetical protein